MQWHEEGHLDLYEIIIVVLICATLVTGFLSWKYLRRDEVAIQYAPVAAQDERRVTPTPLPTSQETPLANPFSSTNPFAGQYENPFQ